MARGRFENTQLDLLRWWPFQTGRGAVVVPAASVEPGGAGDNPAAVDVDGVQPRATDPPAVEEDRRLSPDAVAYRRATPSS